jgi:hypothetical protein
MRRDEYLSFGITLPERWCSHPRSSELYAGSFLFDQKSLRGRPICGKRRGRRKEDLEYIFEFILH